MFARIGMVICFALIGQICLALEAPVSLEALAVQSDRIVRGKVMNLAYSHETNRYGDELIYTYVTVRVSESLKGDRSDLVLKVEGGTHNGVTLSVSDGAVFQNGEEV